MGREASLRGICWIEWKIKFKVISVSLRMFIFKLLSKMKQIVLLFKIQF